jgi:hypothetical protein
VFDVAVDTVQQNPTLSNLVKIISDGIVKREIQEILLFQCRRLILMLIVILLIYCLTDFLSMSINIVLLGNML